MAKKVKVFLPSDAACGLGPDATLQPWMIYAVGMAGAVVLGTVVLLVL